MTAAVTVYSVTVTYLQPQPPAGAAVEAVSLGHTSYVAAPDPNLTPNTKVVGVMAADNPHSIRCPACITLASPGARGESPAAYRGPLHGPAAAAHDRPRSRPDRAESASCRAVHDTCDC